ncbi:MAG: phosphotransferase [Oscillospiraceae bacterium]|jgi:tRNA A-37 threonylcarbamoyl transferase component Bud32|nr:phosphotransferase [Oscillospiraceae bacterium]
MERMELIVERPNKQIFRRGDEKVKCFAEGVPAGDVLSEALNQALAQEAGLPVPPLREVTKHDGRWAIISEFIEGETLLAQMQARPGDESLMVRFVALQMQVHAAQNFKLRRQKDKLHRQISASGLDATTRYELHVRLDAMPDHQKVCHGDFVPSNVVVRGTRAFIIDWAHITQGCAAADAANTHITLCKQSHFALAEQYLKCYCEQSDTALQYIRRWLPIVAGAHLAGCLPGDRAFYQGYCDGVV